MLDLMSTGEAAKRLGCSTSMLRKVERLGLAPPAARVAERRVYTVADVEALRRLLAERRERNGRPDRPAA